MESLLSFVYSVMVEKVNICLGIGLNMILLFLIKYHSNPFLGNYKYLLAIFANYDIFLSVLHGVLNPFIISMGNIFAAGLNAPWQNHYLSAFYFSCFTVPFALMNIPFLYRYWNVAHPSLLDKFSSPRFVCQISMYPIVLCLIWLYFCDSLATDSKDANVARLNIYYHERHNDTIRDGWLMMEHWRGGVLNAHATMVIVIALVIMVCSFSVAATLAILTYREILKISVSAKHRSIHRALLAAVCAQTFVPLACVYVPYFITIMSPFLGITDFGITDNFALLVSFFPGWDAIVIIIMIKDYRLGLLKILGLRRDKKITPINNTQFTASTANRSNLQHSTKTGANVISQSL